MTKRTEPLPGEEPLPGMPKRPARKPRSVSTKPSWAKIKQPKTRRPVMCSECCLQAAEGHLNPFLVQVAVFRRTIGELQANYCLPHASPLRDLDGEKRLDEERTKRSWKRK